MLKVQVPLIVAAVLVQSAWAGQDSTAAKPQQRHKPTAQTSPSAAQPQADEVNALRDQVVAQQQQLQQLQEDLQKRDKLLEDIQSKLTSLEEGATQAEQQNSEAVTGLRGAVTDMQTVNTSLAGEVQQQQKQSAELAGLQSKVKIGTQWFGDFAFYTHTGFGPQFIAQVNQTGPFNAGFNSFDITRAYINVFFTPIEAVTLRITPNIYRQVDGAGRMSLATLRSTAHSPMPPPPTATLPTG